MPPSNSSIASQLETQVKTWPRSTREIARWIKVADDVLDDLSIDMGAVERADQQDGNAVSDLKRKHSAVTENLQTLRSLLEDSRPKKKAPPPPPTDPPPTSPPAAAPDASSAAAKDPPPASSLPAGPRGRKGRSAARPASPPPVKRGRSVEEGQDGSDKRARVQGVERSSATVEDASPVPSAAPPLPAPPPPPPPPPPAVVQTIVSDPLAPPAMVPPPELQEVVQTVVQDDPPLPPPAVVPPPELQEVVQTVIKDPPPPTPPAMVEPPELQEVVQTAVNDPPPPSLAAAPPNIQGVDQTAVKVEPSLNPADMKDLYTMISETESAGDNNSNNDKKTSKKAKTSQSKHRSGIYSNLSTEQSNTIHDDAQAEMQDFLTFNLPLGSVSRTWCRHAQAVLREAAYHSKKLAASVFILSNGRTVCAYHSIHKEGKASDCDVAKPEKVSGVPYPPVKKAIHQPSYLERPMRIGSDGTMKPPRPNSYNPNFTLQRVLEFYIMEPGGIRRMHCGCVLDNVLLEFAFWKRTEVQSEATDVMSPMDSPLRPRDRLFFVTVLDYLHTTLDRIYHYDEEGRRVTRKHQLSSWMNDIREEYSKVSAQHGKELNEQLRKRPLTYVEIPDVEDHREGKGKASQPVEDVEGKGNASQPVEDTEGKGEDSQPVEDAEGKGEASQPVEELEEKGKASQPIEDAPLGEGSRKRKGKVSELDERHYDLSKVTEGTGKEKVPMEQLYSCSDSDESQTVRSPSALRRHLAMDEE
ncbi:hypothetical protein H1R20_g13226, partial [Candolleomyces eurysporus]